MKIVFIGCVKFSYEALKCLLEIKEVEISGVVTRLESSFNADFQSLKEIAEDNDIPCLLVKGNMQDEIYNFVSNIRPDVVYCFGWSYLLNQSILNVASLGVIGYHPAALPQNRGRHPIIWALALGLDITASTFFFMDTGADSGDILSQVQVPININDDADSLYNRLIDVALTQIPDFTKKLMVGTYQRIRQDHTKASYWRKRNKFDGCIDWRMADLSIFNLVRALTKPYVGAHCLYKDQEIKIWKVELCTSKTEYVNIEPGKIVRVDRDIIYIKCGNGILKMIDHDFIELPCEGDYL